jgi:hypothetical protein
MQAENKRNPGQRAKSLPGLQGGSLTPAYGREVYPRVVYTRK